MVLLNHYVALARYNRWMNEKVYARAAELSDEERKRDRQAFFKSIHGTLNHLLLGDRIWLARFAKATPAVVPLDTELYTGFEELRRERAETDNALEAWVASLDDARLAAPFAYTRQGTAYEQPLWCLALHVFNHQTHHRGQVTTLLAQAGKDPGVTDLIAYLREYPV